VISTIGTSPFSGSVGFLPLTLAVKLRPSFLGSYSPSLVGGIFSEVRIAAVQRVGVLDWGVPYSPVPGGVGCKAADKEGAKLAYLSDEEQRQHIIDVVRKEALVDCPTLVVERIENAGHAVTVFFGIRRKMRRRTS
jgi:hypothetical protein